MNRRLTTFLLATVLLGLACFEPTSKQEIKPEEVDKVLYSFTAERLGWNLYENRRENPVPDNYTLLMQVAQSSGYDWPSFTDALKRQNKTLHDQLINR